MCGERILREEKYHTFQCKTTTYSGSSTFFNENKTTVIKHAHVSVCTYAHMQMRAHLKASQVLSLLNSYMTFQLPVHMEPFSIPSL